MQALNPQTLSLLDLQNTNSHVCDFEIPFKGFKLSLVDLEATRFHQHFIVDLISVDTCRVRKAQILSNFIGIHKLSKSLQNVVRVC